MLLPFSVGWDRGKTLFACLSRNLGLQNFTLSQPTESGNNVYFAYSFFSDLRRVLISLSSCIEVSGDKAFFDTLLQLVHSLNEKIMESIPKL